MRNTRFLLTVLSVLFLAACGDKKSDVTADEASGEDVDVADVSSEPSKTAVLLWDASIFDGSTKEKKWLASYQFGNTLTLTGKEEENAEEKRTYVEVVGPDDKSGWINKALLAESSSVSVATADIPLYKNPDIMSVSTNSVKAGDILAVATEDKNGFYQVYGKEKVVKGFINSLEKLSSNAVDLKVSIFYQKALAAKTTEEQVKALQAIINDGSNASSAFYPVVQAKLYELVPEEVDDSGELEEPAESVEGE